MADMADIPIQLDPDCKYPFDKEFPNYCDVNLSEVYCCYRDEDYNSATNFVFCDAGDCVISPAVAGCNMMFPEFNNRNQSMYKTALSGTTKSAWVRIAFQQYKGSTESPEDTWPTILTMGNNSQPFSSEKCMATIKAFQYGWGTVNQGNRCRITIQDQKGSSFQEWVERMGINPEGDTVPIQGKYRMKVQWGWYTTGGAPEDICGQPPTPLGKEQLGGVLQITKPAEGFNSAFIICSPVLYFITDWINVHFEQGKFTYELEGVDTLIRGQENMVNEIFGRTGKQMYFTKAVETLGAVSFPPFRVAFKAINAAGEVVDMQFIPSNFQDRACNKAEDCLLFNFDCQGWGPYDIWHCDQMAPLSVIHEWLKQVHALDLTGKVTSNKGRVGITMNFDPTYKHTVSDIPDPCPSPCSSSLPQYGLLTLWTNGLPYCQGNFNDGEINNRLKAVYVVNGGNCLNGPSEILTENGWERINKIVKFKYNGKVACVDNDGILIWSKVTNWHRNNLDNRKLIKISLHNSRGNRSFYQPGAIFTEDHPILTNQGYVKVKDLRLSEHLINSGTYCPSQEIHEAIVGMILGDGNIKVSSNSFNCAHCWKQKFYAEHKADLLGSQIKEVNKGKYPSIKIRNNASPYWRSMSKLFYKDGKKIITDKNLGNFTVISLAYLYMDDGSINKKRLAEIATCGFKPEEVDILIKKIKSLGIDCYRRPNGRWPRIYFGRDGTNSLIEKISPYILQEFDYKIYEKHRLENKVKLDRKELPFYDTFDLIRCEKLENTTKYVYCIDVENHHNFITHSGVVHNCSPVLQFAPAFRWHSMAAQKASGMAVPIGGTNTNVQQVAGAVRTNCPIAAGKGPARHMRPVRTGRVMKVKTPALQTMEANYHHIMSNLAIGAIEADLRVQGDPSDWLCTPALTYGSCVGIVFINPYFLVHGQSNDDCPVWAANDPDNPDEAFKSICNELLTSKGWFIMGVDHQIKDGSYITTLKLKLLAPGAELNQNTQGSSPTRLGGWDQATPLPYGGQFGCLRKYLVGSAGAAWSQEEPDTWVGGGTSCEDGYLSSPDLPPDD